MYILYLQPLITDIVFELIHLFYVAPSVITQCTLLGDPLGPYLSSFLDSAQTYCWYNNSLSQVSLAVNRFVVTVLLRLYFFTPSRTLLFSFLQHLLAILITITLQYILPCCKIELAYASYSFREVLIPGVFNYGWAYIKLPAKIACSVIPLAIYCVILFSIRFVGKRLNLQSRELSRRRKQELKFTAQFAVIAIGYVLSWGTFSLLPPTTAQWVKG
ncbi:hypothetical protein PMAYCL1PPCAC_11518 [Pristionchus mayeri]|uniref:7TM GPCR serpentine receptor class x (Srx) domain-containing protein n=1 Tax=Pristionchus mayeri TaxID=1317129 RepID=A0AAN4ZMP6_9BILA|nr:hypothetical protein PMAYCL1PPCAC_11518 [Pristionchus mayeri]